MTNENKISPQQEIHDLGVEFAYRANEARDRQLEGAKKLEAINVLSGVSGVEVSREALHSAATDALQAGDEYEAYNDAVGRLIGPEVLQKIEVKPVQDVLSPLTPEQKRRADKLTLAMAEQFNLDPADFSVLTEETETGEKRFTVAYVADQGIHEGSWDNIFDEANADHFIIQVEGEQIDTRAGMTLGAYKALIEHAKATYSWAQTLPDGRELFAEYDFGGFDDDSWTITLLTGEDASEFRSPHASVHENGSVDRGGNPRDDDRTNVRFRPAAVV